MMSDLKIFQINFGGGEPFLREDFFHLLNEAHQRGLVTCISTNGLSLDAEKIRILKDMPLTYLQISLDGAREETNDLIRGKGTYIRIMATIETLFKEGIPFSINCVLTKVNYYELNDLLELAKSIKAELRVSRFRPSGRGKLTRELLAPTISQLEEFASWLDENEMVKTGDSFFCLTSSRRRQKGLDMCGAAKMTLCVSPTGNVYPCAFLQEEAFKAGILKKEHLRDIWNNSYILNALRQIEVSVCRHCIRFDQCRGGCPAIAYHIYGEFGFPDPECLINIKNALYRS